jgi:hypothetical protein
MPCRKRAVGILEGCPLPEPKAVAAQTQARSAVSMAGCGSAERPFYKFRLNGSAGLSHIFTSTIVEKKVCDLGFWESGFFGFFWKPIAQVFYDDRRRRVVWLREGEGMTGAASIYSNIRKNDRMFSSA